MKLKKLYNKLVRRGGILYALWFFLAGFAIATLGVIIFPESDFDSPVTLLTMGPDVFLSLLAGVFLLVPFYYYTARILRIKSTLHEALLASLLLGVIGIAVEMLLGLAELGLAEAVVWLYVVMFFIALSVLKKVYNIGLMKAFLFFLISSLLAILVVAGVVLIFLSFLADAPL